MLDSTQLYATLKETMAPFTPDAHQAMAALWPIIMQALIDAHNESLYEDQFAHLTDKERAERGLGNYIETNGDAPNHFYGIGYDPGVITKIVEQVLERLKLQPVPQTAPIGSHPANVTGYEMLKLAGSMALDDLAEIEQAVQDFETVNLNDWQ